MKKIFYLIILIITVSIPSMLNESVIIENDKIYSEYDNSTHKINLEKNEENISVGDFIPITNFIELASIGRVGQESHFPADGNFLLMNDIELPHISYRNIEVAAGYHGEELRIFQELIPDYFREHFRNAADTMYSGTFDAYRGWKPIPNFSGIFDGQGFTISNLAGNRLSITNVYGGFGGDERNIGLFGDVQGGHIKNLNIEIGQKLEWRGTSFLNGANPTTGQWNRLRSGVAHLTGYGNVGALAGRLTQNAIVENVIVRSRSQDNLNLSGGIVNTNEESNILNSSLQASRPSMGGLVGEVLDSTVRNSGSYVYLRGVRRNSPNCATSPTSGALANDGHTIGGFVGDARRSLIENSFSRGVIRHGYQRVAGFIAVVGDGSTIRNSYAITPIWRVSNGGNNSANVNHAVAGFAHWIAAGARTTFENIFTAGTFGPTAFTRTRTDGFIAQYPNRVDLTNAVVVNPTTVTSALVMTEEQLRNPKLVDNFLNADMSIFHIEEEGQLPTLNQNPQEILRTEICIASANIQSVEGINMIGFLTTDRPLRLTEGEFEIILNHNNDAINFNLIVSSKDIQKGYIDIRRVEFRNYNDASLGFYFFRDGDNINTFKPDSSGRVFAGWYSDINDGERVNNVSGSDITVWARNHNVVIFGVTEANAQIIISAIYLVADGTFEDLKITALDNGEFEIFNLPRGSFKVTIRMNGFVDYIRVINIDDSPIVELDNIFMQELMITGHTLPNTTVIITNIFGQEIARTNTLSTGIFTFARIQDGEYTLTLISSGFIPRTISFLIERLNINFNEYIDEEEILLDVVVISGYARENTVVRLFHNEILIGYTIVSEDGRFIFSAIHTNTPISNTIFEVVTFLETFNSRREFITVTGNASVVNLNFIQEDLITISGVTSMRTTVILMRNGVDIARTNVSSFGEFTFEEVQNGEFTLRLERPRFETVFVSVTVEYNSVYIPLRLLDRIPSDNSHFGVITQMIFVGLIGTSIWIILFKRKNKEETY